MLEIRENKLGNQSAGQQGMSTMYNALMRSQELINKIGEKENSQNEFVI